MPYPLPLTRTEAYLAYKAGVIQQSDLKPSLVVPRNGIDAWLAYWTGLAEDYPKREDGTPHILQEEEAYIAYLCGVLDEYPEKCLRRVGAYLRYLISARWGRPDHPLNREELYLSLIKTQFIPSGDPSSDIEIDGTAKAAFVDVKMYGDTFQQSYEGKNLYDYVNARYPIIRSGIEATLNADGSITTTGLPTSSYVRIVEHDMIDELEDGATYTLSSDSYSAELYIDVAATRVGGGTAYPANTRSGSASFTVDKSAFSQYRISILTYTTESWGSESKTITRKFQLEKGATATSFEPYVGGVPSPNPDYPQPIQTVTGEQVVKVEGKNLLPNRMTSGTIAGAVQNTVNSDGSFTLNGTSTSVSNVDYNHEDGYYIHLEQGKTYTLSVNNAGLYWRLRKVSENTNIATIDSPSTSRTFTANATEDAFLYFVILNNSSFSSTNYKVQLEKGSTPTAYAPYSKQTLPLDLGDIELCKLGDYQDYIYKDGDSWKVHKAINSITYDGTNYGFSYRRVTIVSGKYRFLLEGSAAKSSISESSAGTYFTGVCDMLISGTRDSTYNASGNIVAPRYETSYGNVGIVYADAIAGMTVEQANTWLITHNMTVKYALATPTDTTITDQTLIAQLEALKQGGAEEGTTYIKVSATDPNLPAKLYVEAPKYE